MDLLTKELPLPVAVVQYVSFGFTQGFVEWLSQAMVLQ